MERLEKLKLLEQDLRAMMDEADAKTIAPLAKQYRETLREIEEIEGVENDDEIARILSERNDTRQPTSDQ